MAEQDPPRVVHTLRLELPWRTLWRLLAFAAGIWLFRELWEVVLLVVVTLVLVGTLNPLVGRLEERGLRRPWAVAALFFGLLVVAVLLGVLTLPALVKQVTELVQAAPGYQETAARWLEVHRPFASLAKTVRQGGSSEALSVAGTQVLALSGRAVELLGYGFTCIFLSFYFLVDPERTRGALYALMPRRYHVRAARILLNLQTIVGGYMRGQIITSACITVFALALLLAFRVPNALALAVFAGLTDVLPFIGAVLATTPAVLGALSRGTGPALVVLAAMLAYQEFESRVLVPRVYGRALRLPASAVILALLCGGILLGILGALLALPVAAGLFMAIRELRLELPGEDGDDPALRHRDARAEREYARAAAGAPASEAAQIAVQIADDIRQEDAARQEDAEDVPVTAGEEGAKAAPRKAP
ncbi:AI-2E family transporter [Aggregicoccus sp. 17bor-14]|uniref:AI-2E family transporter n=1 Tax=Myxococcaceae TaxID=31 RepID=UPI00129D0ACB|nr:MULTISPECIES: AI-2E family transporter [Myxococcaceae]MBF5046576.1 AI-2E family transporter [Simulacricoccus sp. 17bor-14]MRI92287.1 AI-2E family transporter [Aggregicoccus sp. 17bor-14]